MKIRNLIFFLGIAWTGAALAGCTKHSYPSDKIKDALRQICREEYGIEDIDVKTAGETIGVYLPLKKLFAADFKEAAITGKIRNLETLFEPSPEALEKVEDVLFSISRVLLSTDKKFKFYVLQATDTEKTGLQLILTGNVEDVKRVRVWDISRNEYRKRVIHELRLNRAVMWHRPVRQFFKDLENLSFPDLEGKYFGNDLPPGTMQSLFLNKVTQGKEAKPKLQWEIKDIRSALIQKNEVIVYVKVRPHPSGQEGTTDLQYLFMLSLNEEEAHILRIVPFQYQNQNGEIQNIPFPKELQIEHNLDKWEQEFPLEDLQLGPFLGQQLTRRVQALAAGDERIQNTFRDSKLNFDYSEEPPPPHFALNIEATLKDFNHYSRQSLVFHEDMLYLLNLASREFVDVLRSYQFGDYHYLSLNLPQEPSHWILGREDLELFRRKKVDLQGLLAVPKI